METPSWALVTAPVLWPITIDEGKDQARITTNLQDSLVDSYIRAATDAAQDTLHRGLLTQTWQLSLPWFAECMTLPMAAPLQNAPLASPSTAPIVQYYDANGTLQTLATTVYDVDTVARPGRIVRAATQAWPSLQADRRAGRVVITYVVGWTDPALIPERIRQGIRMYVAYLDADREGLSEVGARARASAEACWTDVVYWLAPSWYASTEYMHARG